MKIGLKENSDLCGAAVDPRRHREPVLRQGGYRLGQEDERQQAEMKIEQLSVNLYWKPKFNFSLIHGPTGLFIASVFSFNPLNFG